MNNYDGDHPHVLPVAGASVAGKPAPGAARAYHILLVEDDVDTSDMLGALLRGAGHRVMAAFDGPTGLAMAYAHKFDLLVCDIALPGLDGYDLIRDVRASSGIDIPFAIAVSGFDTPEHKAQAITAGFGQYFVKPLDTAALLALIASPSIARLVRPPAH